MKKFFKWFGIIIGSIILIIIISIAALLIRYDRYGFYASGGPISENQASYDVVYYGINIEIFPEDQALSGYVDIKARILVSMLDSIELDIIDNFEITGITDSQENNLKFSHADDKLWIQLADTLRKGAIADLKISYQGQPVEAIFPPWIGGINWSEDSTGADWIGLSCQGEGAKIWMPCKDHISDEPDSAAINITIPKPYYCAASGILDKISDPRPGFQTFHWITHYPINNYNINFNIGRFEIVDTTYITQAGIAMPVYFYVLPQSLPGAREHLNMALDMLYTYRKIYGEYPFINEKFSIVQTDYLGMEHQTINAYGNHYNYDNINDMEIDWLMLHEMGHEWWGNKVTVKDWADLWIHEGICTYGEALFLREKIGEEAYHMHMDSIRSLVTNRSPIIPHRNATSFEAYSGDIYMKGACLMHSLRYILGDSIFFKTLREFVNDSVYTYQNLVETEDFINLVKNNASQDYSVYIRDFLYTTDLPEIKVDTLAEDRYDVSITNIDYELPMDIAVGDSIIRMMVGSDPVEIKSAEPPVIDPKKWYLKTYFLRRN